MNHSNVRARRAMLATLALAVTAAAWTPARLLAAVPAEDFDAAYHLFERANEGDADAITRAADAWASLSARQPTDVVLLTYAGATHAMRARTTVLPWKKMSLAETGLAQIDKALAMLSPADDAPRYQGTPASLETKLVASGTFLALPAMFNRQARGEKLMQSVLASPLFDGAPVGFKANAWLRAGTAAGTARPDEARRLLTLAAQSGTASAAPAKAKLTELGL